MDPELALRGYILSKTKLSPYDPQFTTLSKDDTMLSFLAYWYNAEDESLINKLGNMLGTEWSRDQAESLAKKSDSKDTQRKRERDHLTMPLVVGMNPDVSSIVMDAFGISKEGSHVASGDYTPTGGEEIVELDEKFTKDQFLKFASMAPMISDDNQQKDVTTPAEEVPDKVNKMYEQIRKSKNAISRDRSK